ncbi:MAG: stage II sporulation protein E [Clostridia bacterium]|nr:stage II sporulation protein E [Clostridia bacterium]MDD4047988.1 stage II sporulation protein E [Clostridia bacterium]
MIKVLSEALESKGRIKTFIFEKPIFGYLGFVILGILFSRVVLMGELYPFGTAFLAGVCIVNFDSRRLTFLGVMIGTLLTVKGLPVLGYLGSQLIIYMVLCSQKSKENFHWLITPVLISAIHLLSRGCVVGVSGNELYQWVGVAFESVFIGALAMITVTSIQAYPKMIAEESITSEERTSLGLMLIGILVGIRDITFFEFGLQSIISRWIVLCGALLGGVSGGATVGVVVGLVPSIQGALSTGSIAYYALAGLTGGIFNSFKKIGVVVGFALANLMLSFFFTEEATIIQSLKETAVAIMIFLVFRWPVSKGKYLIAASGSSTFDVKTFYSEKLLKIAHLFYEFEKIFHVDGEKKEKADELNILLNKVTESVCEGCSLKKICWEQNFYKTYRAFLEACTKLETKGAICEKDFGNELKRKCTRLRELRVALNSQIEVLKLIKAYEKELKVCNSVVNQQFIGLAKITENFSTELKKEIKYNDDMGNALVEKLEEKGIKVKEIKVLEIPCGEKEIHIKQRTCEGDERCKSLVAPNISQTLDRTYVLKSKNCSGKNTGYCSYCLVPSRMMQVNVGTALCPKEGVAVSGDVCSAVQLSNQRYALILCDGMGVGTKAHFDSNMSVNMLKELLKADFSPITAVKTVNAALLLKSSRERFVTLDVVIINQLNGQTDFIKTGGAPSMIRSAEGVKVIKASSPPVGILDDIEPQSHRYLVGPKNNIIMVSDGIWDILDNTKGPQGWLEEALEQIDISDPQTLADYILFIAKKAVGNESPDDMCVLVANIENENVG